MQSSKTGHVIYDGKDAVATILSVCSRGELSDAEARAKLEQADLSPKQRRELAKVERNMGIAIALVPAARRRDFVVKATEKVLAKEAKRAQQRALRRQYPVLRAAKMLAIARWFHDEATIQNVFVPIVSDYILEYRDAKRESPARATFVKLKHWYAFANALGLERAFIWGERIAKLVWWLFHRS